MNEPRSFPRSRRWIIGCLALGLVLLVLACCLTSIGIATLVNLLMGTGAVAA